MQYTTNADEHLQDEHVYDDNANYDDVFDTKHVVQAIEDIHIVTNPTYNQNYKLYYDDVEHNEFDQISQLSVDNFRVSTQTKHRFEQHISILQHEFKANFI